MKVRTLGLLVAEKSKYPAVTMRLDENEYEQLVKWADAYDLKDKNGPTPGTLAKKLFRAAMPLFESCDFDDREVRRVVARLPFSGRKTNRGQ